MCCFTVLFAACKKEKPYEKFIGNYEGSCLVDPTVMFENPMIPGQTVTQELDDITIAMKVTISAGNADDQIVMTYKPEDQDKIYTFNGTIGKNNVVAFEKANITETYEGTTVNGTVDMTGTLVENVFSLTGTCNGNGTISLTVPMAVETPITFTGKMTAVLNKVTNTTK